MNRPFDDNTRRNIAELCAGFARLPASEPSPALRRAAVAIVLVEADAAQSGTALLLTLRAAGLRAHRGQWALPGGRCDEGETPVTAALRELHEELGLALGPRDVLGFLVTPVVVWASVSAAISPNPAEVASAHRIPLSDLERDDVFDFVAIPESTGRVIRFLYHGQFIHAPTAAMMYQFREVLAGRDTRVADLEQPVFAWK
jgi:8-oxo-dGTP pyrophosphatase MutT (NUDIX family)